MVSSLNSVYLNSYNVTRLDSSLKKKCSSKSHPCGNACIPKSKKCRLGSKELEKIVSNYELKIRNNKTESAVVINPNNGKLIFSKPGTQDSVYLEPKEVMAMRGAVFTHNHPNLGFDKADPRSKGFSFSEDDIKTACYAQVKEMRAVSRAYQHIINPGKSGWDYEAWENRGKKAYKEAFSSEYKRSMALFFSGGNVAKIEADFHHNVIKKMAKNMGWKYRRIEWL